STRSTPRCSSRGNASPASTTRLPCSCSNTVMFLPTSPSPPSGITRRKGPGTGRVYRRPLPRPAAVWRGKLAADREITLFGEAGGPEPVHNEPMRISTRHSHTVRLLLCLVAAILLALPPAALARGIETPARGSAPAPAHSKTKRAKKRPTPQRVTVHPLAHRTAKRPTKSAHPATATRQTAPAPAPASPPASVPTPAPAAAPEQTPAPTDQPTEPVVEVPAAAVPTIDPTLAQVAQVEQAKQGEAARVRVIVYGTGAEAALAAARARVVTSLPLIDAVSGEIKAARLGSLGLAAGVTNVVVDSPVKATGADPYTALVTLFPRTSGATAAWAANLNGQGVGVAVLDSGVAPGVMDLGNRLVQVKLPGQSSSAIDDRVGHGTFVTEVLAGKAADGRHSGVATGSKVFAVNVSTSGGVYTTDVVNGLAWVLANASANNIKVVNLSLAESTPSSYASSALDQAVEKVWQAGIVVVATSGNLGPNTMYYAPGNDPFVITVGASDP